MFFHYYWGEVVLLLICAALALIGLVVAVVVLTSRALPVIKSYEGEDHFTDPETGKLSSHVT